MFLRRASSPINIVAKSCRPCCVLRVASSNRKMGSYTSDLPSVDFDPAYKKFFEEFYKISDTPDAHEQYAKQFTDDATLIMASKKVQGSAEILELRKSMWTKVATRAHNPVKIFPFGPSSDEIMLYGDVKYTFKAGGDAGLEWGARARLTKENGIVQMKYYQVYMDTAAQAAKKD